MKKLILFILILISFLCFAGLIVITINASELPKQVKTLGFIVLGYLCIILFTIAWFKLFKE